MDAAPAPTWLAAARPRPVVPAPPLTLHRFDPRYAASLAESVNRSLDHLRPWMPWATGPVTEADEAAILADFGARFDEGVEFGYLMLLDDAVVGGTGLHIRGGPGVLEIGYWVDVACVGRGYASAAARALTDDAFSLSEVERVEIRCDEGNSASAAVARRLGYALVSRRAREARAPAESGVELVWAVTRGEWVGA